MYKECEIKIITGLLKLSGKRHPNILRHDFLLPKQLDLQRSLDGQYLGRYSTSITDCKDSVEGTRHQPCGKSSALWHENRKETVSGSLEEIGPQVRFLG